MTDHGTIHSSCPTCGVESIDGQFSHLSYCPFNPKVEKANAEKERKRRERWIFWNNFRSWWDAEKVVVVIILGVTGIFIALIETGVVK